MKNTVFDGYAKKYDKWFLEHENIFKSELGLLLKALEGNSDRRILSVGCGSGFFEMVLAQHGVVVAEGIEPSSDMASIAVKRDLDVKVDTIENVKLEVEAYDVIYFNTSSCYIDDIGLAYKKSYNALKVGGKLIIIDIPKESAFGLMYLLLTSDNVFEDLKFEGAIPNLQRHKRMIEILKAARWRTTEEKVRILEKLRMKNFRFLQTLIKNPFYSDEEVEETIHGYKSGSYVAIIAEK